MMMFIDTLSSPVGQLEIRADQRAITNIRFIDSAPLSLFPSELTRTAVDQLQAYFGGQLSEFDLPLSAKGSDFQQRVWQALLTIPFGQTWTYGQLATHIGKPAAARAVGAANRANPIAIIIPCHRVNGANGQLTGYAGGLDRKEYLLTLEVQAKSFMQAV